MGSLEQKEPEKRVHCYASQLLGSSFQNPGLCIHPFSIPDWPSLRDSEHTGAQQRHMGSAAWQRQLRKRKAWASANIQEGGVLFCWVLFLLISKEASQYESLPPFPSLKVSSHEGERPPDLLTSAAWVLDSQWTQLAGTGHMMIPCISAIISFHMDPKIGLHCFSFQQYLIYSCELETEVHRYTW